MPETDAINNLIATHSRRLHELQEKKAILGVSPDPAVDLEIEELEAKLDDLRAQLPEHEVASASADADPPAFRPEMVRPYLPYKLYSALTLEQSPRVIEENTDQLRALLETVETYCATPILTEARPAPHQVQGRWLDATLLFSDISGFTAMSERLNARGRAGAEEITRIVNDYFTAMVDILYAAGGDLLKFGGDAMLGLFTGPPKQTARFATQAALDMQRAMSRFMQIETSVGTFELQMKVGLHTGPIFSAHVGSSSQMELWVTGEEVNHTAEAEEAAQRGQVIVSEATWQYLKGWHAATPASTPGFYALSAAKMRKQTPSQPPPFAPDDRPQTIGQIARRLDTLVPYLPAGLLPRLIYNPTSRRVNGEHRLVAVLFVNVLGFSKLTNALGGRHSDRLTATIQDYFATMQAIVQRHGGVINKTDLYSSGDKLLVIFGAPVAHEDDVDQAARAAVAMHTALTQVNRRLADRCPGLDVRLQQRIGLSTGYAFSGNVGSIICQEYTIMGDEVNLAARLMSSSGWGETLVSSHVFYWLEAFGEFEPVGDLSLKGKQDPVPVYRLLAMGETHRPKPPFVDRTEARRILNDCLKRLSQGQEGWIMSLVGEPGIGKSRLLAEFRPQAEANGILWLKGHCREQQESYHVLAEIVRDYLHLEADDDPATQLDVLTRAIEDLFGAEHVDEKAPFLALLLDLPLRDHWKERLEALEDRLADRLTKDVAAFFEQLSWDRPVILNGEDLHWLDEASVPIFQQIMALVEFAPVMLAFTLRPDQHPPYEQLSGLAAGRFRQWHQQIVLEPLDNTYTAEMVTNIYGREDIPPEDQMLIYERSQGNPLFIGEITRLSSEELDRSIPDRLQKMIESRVDALPEAPRQVIKAASAIGIEFSLSELAYVMVRENERDIRRYLAELRRMQLIRMQGKNYGFSQPMAREVVYNGLDNPSRQMLHRQLGMYWSGENKPQKAAHHYLAGQIWDRALEHAELAADRRGERYAYQEAARLYQQALQAAEQLRDTGAQARLCGQLGQVYYHLGQFRQAVKTHQRELGYHLIQLADPATQAHAHYLLARSYDRWGNFDAALVELERGLSLLGTQTDPVSARLHLTHCSVLTSLGRLDEAVNEGLAAADIAAQTGDHSAEAYAFNNLGAAYGTLGQFDRALEAHQRSLALRRESGTAHEVAQSLENVGSVLLFMGKLDDAEARYREALEIQTRIGDQHGEGSTRHNLAWVYRQRGEPDAAEAAHQKALELWRHIEHGKGVAFALNDLGTLYQGQGRFPEAREHLEESARLYEELGVTAYLSENYAALADVYTELGEVEKAQEARAKADNA